MFRLKCYYLVCLVIYFAAESHAGRVSFIKPCKANDDKCIASSGQAAVSYIADGVPEIGLPVSDPIAIEAVRNDGPNLKLGFRNIKISGVKKCKIITLSRNTEKSTIKMVVECPLVGVGQYDINGKLLFFQVIGDGDFKIQTEKVRISVEIKIKDIQKNGHRHWKVTGFDYSYEILEKVYIDLKNLFNGDEALAKPFREVLDHSWRELIEEVGDPIITQVIAKYVDIVKTFFLAVPADELELI